jgi:hypothetical protein
MNNGEGTEQPPPRWRVVLASFFVVLTVLGAWKFIDYRTQAPPPPPSRPTAEIPNPKLPIGFRSGPEPVERQTPSKDQIPN